METQSIGLIGCKEPPSNFLDRIESSFVYDLIRDIKDPEHPCTLEQLDVVNEDQIDVKDNGIDECLIKIQFTPTVPHCTLVGMIALCIREKINLELQKQFKLDIFLTPKTHDTELEINKQVNDKERVAAAREIPSLKCLIDEYINYSPAESYR